ncbi:heme oxygenase 2 [Phlebotomus argentipes]|uniref:heme oxygenase 2 n=1 Tax=Phlebotomus argentipes TaxID=94469 RepID=UPI002893141F|nr:heme oxygenase 2 [Phlebotomus argentipes]
MKMGDKESSFTKDMRKATRNVHSISDALVNAKLAFALSDDGVWADGLLIFYEVFKFLERNVPETILPVAFHRRTAFEKDLSFYLGKDWEKSYQMRKEVAKYVEHLQSLKERNAMLLVAYVYHLYMGLLSGGQILQKKRRLAKNFTSGVDGAENGMAVTDFGSVPIHELKTRMRRLIDQLAQSYSDETKSLLIEESEKVFQYNNSIIRTVKDVNKVGLRKFLCFSGLFFILYLIYKVFTT